MEACTGWLFVARALERSGAVAHLAETVETRALRGRNRRAKTDRQDALWLRELLAEGRLPESWIAPEHIRQWRSRLHLRKALIDERIRWLLRIRSTLYHHGLSPGAPGEISSPNGREFLASLALPLDAKERVVIALRMIDMLDTQIHELERELRKIARHQAGCQALMTQFGVGELIALVTLTELGDVTRLSSSRKAVRFAGIDIGVHRSDQTSRVGKLTRQGSPTLRWALYEAAQSATRLQSPDYSDYHALKARGLTHTRASLTIARKITQLPPSPRTGPGGDRTRWPNTRSLTAPIYRCRQLAASSRSFPGPTISGDPDKDRAAAVAPRDDRSTITSRAPHADDRRPR